MIDDIVIIDNVIPLEKQEELKQQTARIQAETQKALDELKRIQAELEKKKKQE